MARTRRTPKPALFGFENTISLDGIDYLLRQAQADELAAAIVGGLEPQQRADILATIMQGRLNQILEPPANLPAMAERLRSFTAQPEPETLLNAEAGTEPA